MKKIYFLSCVLLSTLSFGQVFTATYDFALVTATSGLTDPSPVPTGPGLTFGSFSAANATSTNSTGAGRFSIANQPLGATTAVDTYATLTGVIDLNTYFQVTITPVAGTTYDLTGITFTSQRSGTGVRTYSVRSSADSYATNLPASINPLNAELSVQVGDIFYRNLDATTTAQIGSTITLGAGYTGITTPVTFRFYGWNAEAAGGTFSIDNVVISGNTTTLSVKQNNIAGLTMYPNPTNGVLRINSNSNEVKEVVIYDMLGKQVLKTKTENTINTSAISKGIYVVKITEAGKTATRKLIVE